jgi:hypothetical protein
MSLTELINSKSLSDVISGGTRVTAVAATSGAQSDVVVRAVTGSQKIALHGFAVSASAATTITLKLGTVTIYTLYLAANSTVSPNIPWTNPPLGGKGKNLTISSTAGSVSISANVALVDVAPITS